MPHGFDLNWKPPILEETHEYDHEDHLKNQHGEWWSKERTRLSIGVRPASKSVTEVKAFLLGIEDKDKDGTLDMHELTDEIFDALDKDGSGTLDKTEFKYDVDHVDAENGKTMLHYAATAGRYDVVRFLVSADADLNVRDWWDHKTPIQMAMQNSHTKVVEYLKNPIKDEIIIHRPSDEVDETGIQKQCYPTYKVHPDGTLKDGGMVKLPKVPMEFCTLSAEPQYDRMARSFRFPDTPYTDPKTKKPLNYYAVAYGDITRKAAPEAWANKAKQAWNVRERKAQVIDKIQKRIQDRKEAFEKEMRTAAA